MRKSRVGPSVAPTRPPAHSICATRSPPRSAAWASVSACRTPLSNADRAVGERLPVDVERVVRRAGHARPGAGAQRVPAGAGVRRRLREQTAIGGGSAAAQQLTEPGNDVALLGIGLDAILHEAIGGEEQQLGPILVTVGGVERHRRRHVRRGPPRQHRHRDGHPCCDGDPPPTRRRPRRHQPAHAPTFPGLAGPRCPDAGTPYASGARPCPTRPRISASDPVWCRRPAGSSPGGRRSGCPSTPRHGARRTPGCRTGSARSPG